MTGKRRYQGAKTATQAMAVVLFLFAMATGANAVVINCNQQRIHTKQQNFTPSFKRLEFQVALSKRGRYRFGLSSAAYFRVTVFARVGGQWKHVPINIDANSHWDGSGRFQRWPGTADFEINKNVGSPYEFQEFIFQANVRDPIAEQNPAGSITLNQPTPVRLHIKCP